MIARFALPLLIAAGLVSACDTATPSIEASPAKQSGARVAPSLATPQLEDVKPLDYAGVHNVVAYGPALYSGSAPEGEEGIETLAKMGIATIVSVDGAVPDVATAKALGMRYVHLPINYSGMSDEREREIARAIRDLPGPIFVHCHHGKHRSAAAAGVAAVQLGILSNAEAIARMKVSGTAPNYKGLYACVESAQRVDNALLASASGDFPEVSRPSGIVDAMVEIDEIHEHLKAIEKAGWVTPKDHPDLVPAAEASRFADIFRELGKDASLASRGPDFAVLLSGAARNAQAFEDALSASEPDRDLIAVRFKQVAGDCKACHVVYRD